MRPFAADGRHGKPPTGPKSTPTAQQRWAEYSHRNLAKQQKQQSISIGPRLSAQQYQRPMPNQQRHRISREEWRHWDEVVLKIKQLPPSVKTKELWSIFKDDGNVVRINIFENRTGYRSGEASVTFSPPPAKDFWSANDVQIELIESNLIPVLYRLDISLQEWRPKHRSQSEIHSAVRYPDKMTLPAMRVDFGFMFSEHELMCMQTVNSDTHGQVSLTANLYRSEMLIEFPLTSVEPARVKEVDYFKFAIRLRDLKDIWEASSSENEISWVMSAPAPPRFFRKIKDVSSTFGEERVWTEQKTWARQTDLVRPSAEPITRRAAKLEREKRAPLTFRKDQAFIDIGRWTTYRLTFNRSNIRSDIYDKLRHLLTDYNIRIYRPDQLSVLPRQESSVWDIIDSPKSQLSQKSNGLEELISGGLALSWAVRYQLESCISQGCINERNITRDFIQRLLELSQVSERRALSKLELATDRQKRIYSPMDIFDLDVHKVNYATRLPRHCIMQRSATVTPSTIYLSAPAPEVSNRILRNFKEHAHRFLRVRFTDEKNEGRINPSADLTSVALYNRIFLCLRDGIQIGDLRFEFLAAGNSQFREHGAYFFAPTKYLTTEMIRRGMGDFKHIKTVAKYASRLGQCFSTTRAIRHSQVQIHEAPDVTRKGYNFTDGVGKISEYLGSSIAADLRLPDALTTTPSVFQFRMGGSKGVVGVWPGLPLSHMHLRASQYKFPAQYTGLEIIRWSTYSAPRLNRQLITVLRSLRVPDQVCLEKLDFELAKINKAMQDERTALVMLQQQVDANQMTLEIAGIVHDEFIRTQDPFAVSMLRLWRSWSLKMLKEKAAIPIKDGAFLLGCSDETVTLRGYFNGAMAAAKTNADRVHALPQIFVQVPDFEAEDKSYKIVKGVCIVARNPSLHPGDIRVVNAIDVPELHHLRDVVVFPQTGDRDVPNMCSGGDLDGDDFVIIWDKDLIPPMSEWDCPAMDFAGPKPEEIDGDVNVQHIAQFFVQYMQNDTLRSIATWHLANADGLEGGVRNPKCLKLAEQHSIAVDYPKSGIPPNPHPTLRPQRYPHFMPSLHRSKEQTYHSRSVLGILYDRVPQYDFQPLFVLPFDQRVLNAFNHDENRLKEVSEIKHDYDLAVRRVMAQHDIGTEFEIWSSFVMTHAKVVNDYKIAEEIGRISSSLKEQFMDIIHDKAGKTDFATIAPWVAAMYTVTAQETKSTLDALLRAGKVTTDSSKNRIFNPADMPLISFPWIFHRELGKIARGSKAMPLLDVPVETPMQMPRTRKTQKLTDFDDPDDVIETTEGIVRGGEELVLNFPDDATALVEADDGSLVWETKLMAGKNPYAVTPPPGAFITGSSAEASDNEASSHSSDSADGKKVSERLVSDAKEQRPGPHTASKSSTVHPGIHQDLIGLFDDMSVGEYAEPAVDAPKVVKDPESGSTRVIVPRNTTGNTRTIQREPEPEPEKLDEAVVPVYKANIVDEDDWYGEEMQEGVQEVTIERDERPSALDRLNMMLNR